MEQVKQLTKGQAIKFGKSKIWKTENWTARQIVEFQLFQKILCMPFDVFHEAMEKALGRPVYTHEFGLNVEGLKKELLGEKSPPTLEEIIQMIPAEKRVVVMLD